MSKLETALNVIQCLKNDKDALDGYLKGDIVELFEILSEHDKLEEFQFLVIYVRGLDAGILEYMADQTCRLVPRHETPPYAKKPYRDILWSIYQSSG